MGLTGENSHQDWCHYEPWKKGSQLDFLDFEQIEANGENGESAGGKELCPHAVVEQGIDGIIFEDYNKGVLTSYLISSVMILAKFHGIPTSVDPKKDQFFSYRGCTLFKPNLKELKEGLKVEFDFKNDKDSFLKAVVELEERLENEISFITLSEYGVFIQAQGTPHFIPAHLRNIADVSGAGDTVIAVATLCLVAGASAAEIAAIANIAGGLVCEQPGVVSIEKERLLNEVNNLL